MFNCTKATALALLTAMTISFVPATAFAETNGEGDVIGPGTVEASGDGWDTVQSGDQDQTPGTPDSQTPDTPVVPADPTTPEEPDTPVVPADQQASGQDEQTPANTGTGTDDQAADTQTPEPAEPEEPVIVDPFDLIPVAEGEWGTTNDGKKCFVDTQGNIVTGLVRIQNKIYFFDLETGVMATGWKTFEDGSKRYFLSDGSAVVSKWYTISKVKYYFDDIGIMATGLQKINGKYYYFDTNGKPKTGWITVGNVKYYFGSDYVGYANKWLTYKKNKYYFNSEGRMVTYLYKIGGKLYFFDSSGRRRTGWITYYGDKYYFYSDGHGAVCKWVTYKKNKYFFNGSGKMEIGLVKISGKLYYFDSTGKRRTGWITLGSDKYYFYSDGHGAVCKWVTYKKNKYFFNGSGKMERGLVKISGKQYYFDSNGKMKTGLLTIDGNKYYFYSDGHGAVCQWVTISKKKYFFNGSGKMETGIVKISGKYYMFTSAGVLTSGFASMNDGRVYFTTSGIVSGWQVINNKSYYFDKDTYCMVYGTQVIEGKTYYFNSEGVLQKSGWFTCEDGTKYYLDNGVPKRNAWVTDASGNKFYMGSDGHPLVGQHTIGKNVYYFYDNGRMAKDVTIAGYHYNKSGVMDYKRVDASDVSWHAKNYGSYAIGTKEADDNATLIASQLMLDFGWTFEACCGLLGNITYEGGFNPWQWEIAYTNKLKRLPTMEEARTTGYGYGLIGWTGARKYIFNNATTKGIEYFPNYNQESYSGYGPNFYDCPGDPNDGRAQTKLIGVAMSRGNGNIWVKRKKVTQQEFTKLTSVEDAALYWLWNAEYPASLTTSAYQNTENRRITAAKTWYDRLGGATFVPIKVT